MIADVLRKAIDAIERLDPKWTLPSNIHSCSEGAITFTKGTDDGVILSVFVLLPTGYLSAVENRAKTKS